MPEQVWSSRLSASYLRISFTHFPVYPALTYQITSFPSKTHIEEFRHTALTKLVTMLDTGESGGPKSPYDWENEAFSCLYLNSYFLCAPTNLEYSTTILGPLGLP